MTFPRFIARSNLTFITPSNIPPSRVKRAGSFSGSVETISSSTKDFSFGEHTKLEMKSELPAVNDVKGNNEERKLAEKNLAEGVLTFQRQLENDYIKNGQLINSPEQDNNNLGEVSKKEAMDAIFKLESVYITK